MLVVLISTEFTKEKELLSSIMKYDESDSMSNFNDHIYYVKNKNIN